MKVIVLTSSRADYGIYRPLLKRLYSDSFFETELIVFGSHLSVTHGNTIQEIEQDDFPVLTKVKTPVNGNTPQEMVIAMAGTMQAFSSMWLEKKAVTDLIFCLGDRFEMFAATSAAVPFGIPIAHIHGGETTLGAIDNTFREALTCISSWHFTSTTKHAQRVTAIKGSPDWVYNVGALSLDNLADMELLDIPAFKQIFGIDLAQPTVLITFHPETVAYEKNEEFVVELLAPLREFDYQYLITLPNTDTGNQPIRNAFVDFSAENKKAVCVESLGTLGYFSAMQHCAFLLGNSSSGIIEALSFKKYAINIGDRQKGREAGENVLHCPIKKDRILEAMQQIPDLPMLSGKNLYGDGQAAEKIIQALKSDWSRFNANKKV